MSYLILVRYAGNKKVEYCTYKPVSTKKEASSKVKRWNRASSAKGGNGAKYRFVKAELAL